MTGNDLHPVGTLRPSQLLWSFGPGAIVDLPRLSVIVMGLDRWNDRSGADPVNEERLLWAVRRHHSGLARNVDRLLVQRVPSNASTGYGAIPDDVLNYHVPVSPFPQWLRCPICGRLAPADCGVFELAASEWFWDRVAYVHTGCSKSRGKNPPEAVPARFLVACENGHLDDFPWHYYVHRGKSSCKGPLKFLEQGSSLETENLRVECEGCGASRSMVEAFGRESAKHLPSCRGRHPHLSDFDNSCNETLRTVLLGASNAWFPVTLSALTLPKSVSPIREVVEANANLFKDVSDATTVETLLGAFRNFPDVDQRLFLFSAQDIFDTLNEVSQEESTDETVQDTEDLKTAEWELLSGIDGPKESEEFIARVEEGPPRYSRLIEKVIRLERIREVQALLGFTRIAPPDEEHEQGELTQVVSLGPRDSDWLPASIVRGEGLFIRFRSSAIDAWRAQSAVREHMQHLLTGHRAYRHARGASDPSNGFPGIVYTMLHTLSHLLIRELSVACGYNAASIRERIYGEDQDGGMAGILLYTASPDSDGTLGGLVDLGRSEKLEGIIAGALNRALSCSSDPLCAEHNADDDNTLHNAACHSCVFVPETSCERSNRYADRALVVPTVVSDQAAFFEELLS